jgi:hypothetical protein
MWCTAPLISSPRSSELLGRSIMARQCDASADVLEATWVLSNLAYLTL